MEPFLRTRTNLATLSTVGKMPVENEITNISANWVEITFLSSFNIFVAMLFATTDLFEFREDLSSVFHIYRQGLEKRSFDFCLLGNQKSVWVSN